MSRKIKKAKFGHKQFKKAKSLKMIIGEKRANFLQNLLQ